MTVGDLKIGDFFQYGQAICMIAGTRLPRDAVCIMYTPSGDFDGITRFHQEIEVTDLTFAALKELWYDAKILGINPSG